MRRHLIVMRVTYVRIFVSNENDYFVQMSLFLDIRKKYTIDNYEEEENDDIM